MLNINNNCFSDEPHSYGGKNRLYKLYNNKDVDKALSNNDVYNDWFIDFWMSIELWF